MEDLAEVLMFRAAMLGPQSEASGSDSSSSSGFWAPRDLQDALRVIGEYCEKHVIKKSKTPETAAEEVSADAADTE